MGLLGRLIFRKEAMGFGDVKLFAAAGLILGLKGAAVALILTIFSSAAVFGAGLILGKLKPESAQPLGPFIAASTAVCILFGGELQVLVALYLQQP